MLTWSIRARACRSASKRATTWRLSMPGLMTLRATLRWTGWVCSAMKTVPMPPSPICCKSLYGPMTVPGLSVVGASVEAPLHLAAQVGVGATDLVQIGGALGRVDLGQGDEENGFGGRHLGHGRPPHGV